MIMILFSICLVLFGLDYLSKSLENNYYGLIDSLLQKVSINKKSAFISGILASFITFSSTIVSLITIVLVNSKKISLQSAIIIILGANIGTSFTSLITSFNLFKYYYIIIIVGFIIYNIKKINLLGKIILGIGFLFMGLYILRSNLFNYYESNFLNELLIKANNSTFLSIIGGIVITFLIQSSSGVTSIVQSLSLDNILTLKSSLLIVLGSNIGTTITCIICSFNKSYNTKAVAISNFLVNFIGVVLVLPIISLLSKIYIINNALTISIINILFNLFSCLLGLLYISKLESLSLYLVRSKKTICN